ncbi:hypothetical protein LCD36_04450 [Saccharopolyspora sp. 6T]|uniref:hypothetical protein n=1 Tax=Saccharopolyspora sp. 6T TaxID=2877238 RepID=UPI001CD1B5F4|nr:hypothetical protein [Saccharopolyspora sp. 6T]MCA1185702.1 hypothetical protein [Saccharopolyspora sp. 6T]
MGGMVALPVPRSGIDRSPERIGGVHTSRNGSKTVDHFGMKRSWSLAFDWRYQHELEAIRLMHYGAITGPYRLIDPMVRNRLSAEVSSTGSVRYDGVTIPQIAEGTAGVAQDWPPGISAMPLSSSIEWAPPDAGGVLASSAASAGVPLVLGDTVTFSAYVRCLTGRQVQAVIQAYTAAGVSATSVTGSSSTSAGWQRVTATLTPSSSDAVAVVSLTSPSGTGVIRTAAWQVEAASVATPWMLGGGCPEVVLDQMSELSPYFPMSDAGLTLLEV